jgi:hypothetical protein
LQTFPKIDDKSCKLFCLFTLMLLGNLRNHRNDSQGCGRGQAQSRQDTTFPAPLQITLAQFVETNTQ